MSRNPEGFSDYSFSEYSQPTPPEKVDYADPRFYQDGPVPQSVSSQKIDYADPRFYQDGHTQITSGLEQYAASGSADEPLQMSEYKGPASLEHYTVDVGAEQREAAKNGSVNTTNQQKKRLVGLSGTAAVILGIVLKFGLASISALVSVVVYAQLFGWSFAIGLVALLFIHESGHAVVMKLKGIPIGAMVFIPMLGAAVVMRRTPRGARDEAEVGIAGPVAGALASLVCLLIALALPTSPGIWAALAYFGFFLNLLNLIPVLPLDGGRVLAAVDRRVWLVGFVGLVAVEIWQWAAGNFSIWLLIFIILAATQFWTRGGPNTPEAQAYYAVPWSERVIIGLAYFGLIAALILGMAAAHGLMVFGPLGGF
jgi:Zn-dependent protease